ncbi:MAG: sulfatase-like hydrolase/transferase [Parachlamydiales bacterium]|nr:sulfatase-like hydrolase/transferase [Parachlamydiales bacterium]
MIADIVLFKFRNIRMQFSFLRFLKSFNSFYHSAKELPRKETYHIILGTFIYDFILYQFFQDSINNCPSSLWITIFVCAGIASIFGFLKMEKSSRYFITPVFFLDEAYYCKKLLSLVRRKNKKKMPIHFNEEKSHFLSSQYPLLRFSEGFSGPQTFSTKFSKEKPHLIFIFMESFRTKNIGSIQGEIGASPCFDAYAKKGILFKNFYANGVLTHKSFFSSFFGIFPPFSISNLAKYDDYPLIGLPQIMKSYHYKTAMIHNGNLTFENQLSFFKNHGFDEVIGKKTIEKKFSHSLSTSWGLHDEYLMQYATDWLEKQTSSVFLSLFTISNHHPWHKPDYFKSPSFPASGTYSRFLETFHYSDHALGLFLDTLQNKGFLEKSLIFILADHGQPMGEHNKNYSNQRYLYEENIKIPLLILGADIQPHVINDIGSQVDLLPTVMDLLHLEGFHHSIGKSLARNIPKNVYFNNPYEQGYFGLRNGNNKYIYNITTEDHFLYDLSIDPQETCNQSFQDYEKTKTLHSQAKEFYNFFNELYQEKRFTPQMSGTPQLILKNTTDEKLIDTLKKNPHPFLIEISHSKITDKSLIQIAKMVPNLCILKLNHCSLITDKGMAYLVRKCKGLMSLSLNHAYQLSNKSILSIMKHCPYLEELSLEGVYKLTDKAFQEKNSSLIRLNMHGCKNISDNGLLHLKCSPYLEYIHLSCLHITDEGLKILGEKYKHLQQVILWDAENISEKGIEAIYNTNPQLKTFSINHH